MSGSWADSSTASSCGKLTDEFSPKNGTCVEDALVLPKGSPLVDELGKVRRDMSVDVSRAVCISCMVLGFFLCV